jgi:thiamine pyrophosphate-dependent acetolactate synthase large subunit-like protein
VTSSDGAPPLLVSEASGLDPGADSGTFVSDTVIDLLVRLGCRYVPLTPGASFRGLHDSLVARRARGDIDLLLCLHEEAAVAAAHGYAKATGEVGVAMVHNLVGLMHASMAVYNAWRDRVPLLVLGGSGPRRETDRRPIEWIHVAPDQGQLVRDFVKWRSEPADARGLLEAIVRGHTIAATPPYGPVYISVDATLQEELAPDLDGVPSGPLPRPRPISAAPSAQIETAAEWLVDADQPMILAGAGSRDARYGTLLQDLAQSVGALCVDGWNTVSFPSRFPLAADRSALEHADVLVRVDVTDADAALAGLTGRSTGRGRHGRRVIDLRPAGDHSGWAGTDGPDFPVDLALAADPTTGLTQLVAAVSRRAGKAGADWHASVVARLEAARADDDERARRHDAVTRSRWDDRPVSPERLVAELWQAVRERPWRLVLRNDRSWPPGIWQFSAAGQYLGGSGGGGVGYGPGAMLGGALAARDLGELPVGIVGDGDLLMCPTALWTAVAHQVPLLVVANNNQSFYNDEAHQRQVAEERGRPLDRASVGTRIDQPPIHLPSLARSMGAWACGSIDEPHLLRSALAEAIAAVEAGRVAFVDVITAAGQGDR